MEGQEKVRKYGAEMEFVSLSRVDGFLPGTDREGK
jgi:hypothetical protein